MNNFGPKPAPSAIKNLAGNPGKRAINTLEPQPERETPQCPDWMPAIGRYQWDKIVPELDRLGMLTKLDSAILEGFCALYAEFVTTVQRGEPIKGALMGQLRFHAGELGLTPTSRARLTVPPGQEDDQAELFFH